MTTFKGAMRSYGATVRRIERAQEKSAREAAKRFKEQQKYQEVQNARQAVIDWENYVNIIQSIHKNCTNPIDWNQIRSIQKPEKPAFKNTNEIQANNKLVKFKPTLFNKFFGSTQKKISQLKDQIEKAKNLDKKIYSEKLTEYEVELKNWEELQNIADSVYNKQPSAYIEALEYFNPFSDIGELGTQINLNFEENLFDIDLKVNSEEVVPNYELKQTSTGKLSKKNMPIGRFNELYQDHICSSILRVAREVFAYLPIKKVRINAITDMLNSSTGHIEPQPILSVIFVPETIEKLNLETIDPSDSMKNFIHNMKFNKTNGFSQISKVEW